MQGGGRLVRVGDDTSGPCRGHKPRVGLWTHVLHPGGDERSDDRKVHDLKRGVPGRPRYGEDLQEGELPGLRQRERLELARPSGTGECLTRSGRERAKEGGAAEKRGITQHVAGGDIYTRLFTAGDGRCSTSFQKLRLTCYPLQGIKR